MKSIRASPRLRAKELRSKTTDCSNSNFSMMLRPRKTSNYNPLIQHRNDFTPTRPSQNKKRKAKRAKRATVGESFSCPNLTTAATTESPSSPTPSFTTTFNYSTQTDFLLDIVHAQNLKNQLKKATMKFDKACKQLILLDQHMSDLQNSYTNSLENDRKTFKIVYRMQLATLEGTHNAYIEYIERQVEKIKKLKQLIFSDNSEGMTALHYSHSTDTLPFVN